MTHNQSANELAELYDAFGRFHNLLGLVADNLEENEAAPVEEWQQAVYKYWAGTGPPGAPSYGRQQHDRNEFSIREYRDMFGDGDKVTDFRHQDVSLVDERVRAAVDDLNPVVPVAPESDSSLPVRVRNDDDIETAMALLSEFPAYPEADVEPPDDPVDENDVSLPDGRVDEVKITVLDYEANPDSHRDATMQVRIEKGAEMSLDIWSTHDLSFDWAVGTTYLLEQPRHKTWEIGTELRHELSSTKDLQVTRVNKGDPNPPIRTDNRRSDDDGSGEDGSDGILDDVISEFEGMSDMESS